MEILPCNQNLCMFSWRAQMLCNLEQFSSYREANMKCQVNLIEVLCVCRFHYQSCTTVRWFTVMREYGREHQFVCSVYTLPICTQECAKINVFQSNVPRRNREHMCCLQLVLFWQMLLMLCWDSALALSMFVACFVSCRQLTHMTVYLQSCYPTLWSCWWDVSFMYG